MEILIGFAILYVTQAVLIYGMTFGYFEIRYPSMRNVSISLKMAIVGGLLPLVGPVIIFTLSEKVKYGLRYK